MNEGFVTGLSGSDEGIASEGMWGRSREMLPGTQPCGSATPPAFQRTGGLPGCFESFPRLLIEQPIRMVQQFRGD